MKVKARSKDTIKNIANEIRKILKISNYDNIDIIKVLEHAVVETGEEINLEIVEYKKMPDDYAKFIPEENMVFVREDVYDSACAGEGRHRFTIAHEIGHILMHRYEVQYTRNEKIPIYCDPEWQANTFARNLLCPLDGIEYKESIEEISEKYGVSKQVAEIQYQELKK